MRPVVAIELSRHIRLTILRALLECKDLRSNESFLTTTVDEIGLSTDRAEVVTELKWLSKEKMVDLSKVSGLVVAQLTELGEQIGRGRKLHEGVRRPAKRS